MTVAMSPECKSKCHQCVHYFITHDAVFRYGCRALGFKSRSQPGREVIAASGEQCLYFQAKPVRGKLP